MLEVVWACQRLQDQLSRVQEVALHIGSLAWLAVEVVAVVLCVEVVLVIIGVWLDVDREVPLELWASVVLQKLGLILRGAFLREMEIGRLQLCMRNAIHSLASALAVTGVWAMLVLSIWAALRVQPTQLALGSSRRAQVMEEIIGVERYSRRLLPPHAESPTAQQSWVLVLLPCLLVWLSMATVQYWLQALVEWRLVASLQDWRPRWRLRRKTEVGVVLYDVHIRRA